MIVGAETADFATSMMSMPDHLKDQNPNVDANLNATMQTAAAASKTSERISKFESASFVDVSHKAGSLGGATNQNSAKKN